jgi:phosphatidylserine decarboxylase
MGRGVIASQGYPFIAAGLVLIFLGFIMARPGLLGLGVLAAGFLAYFYRDPERVIPAEPGAIVAPADGKVVLLDEVPQTPFLEGPSRRLAVFMNVFDVHVNRAPVAGTVTVLQHREGKFKAAFRQDAGHLNEQQAVVLQDEAGRQVMVVQIAGVLARRIIPFVKKGDRLVRGERLGMICFGSRVDLYLPWDCQLTVRQGDRVKAGATVVGRWA